MDIKLIVIGKIKEKFIVDGINEYLKRIKPFANLEIIEIKELNNFESERNLIDEGKNVLKNITTNDFVVTLEIEGKMLSSTELADYISKHYTYNNKVITFVIGSSDGLSEEVKKRSDFKLSFSKMTFPHQLMRLVFLEQLYRAFSIINNSKYHK